MLRRFTFASTAVPSLVAKSSSTSSSTSLMMMFTNKRFTSFVDRHIGPEEGQYTEMLQIIKAAKMKNTTACKDGDAAAAAEAAVDHFKDLNSFSRLVVPDDIQRPPMAEYAAETEAEALQALRATMSKNKPHIKSLIGQGYFEAITPPAIVRNVLESPAWYTPYTPYQAEISQGRLECLLYFQTAVCDLTKMPLANSSLLDEATAAWEACSVAYHHHKKTRNKFFVSQTCFKSSIEMIRTRAAPLGIEIVVGDAASFEINNTYCGMLVQSPDTVGTIRDYSLVFEKAHEQGLICVVATDLMSCVALKPPGEMNADVVVGNAQRLGIPLGYGGPHPAFFAVRDKFKRLLPGRLIGWSEDANGNKALRMALQTREQHIKREHATSNICTAQALLANMAALYTVYHGREGLQEIANRIHRLAKIFATGLTAVGIKVVNEDFFDTVTFKVRSSTDFVAKAVKKNVNVFVHDEETVSVSMDEATKESHLLALLECAGLDKPKVEILEQSSNKLRIPESLARTSTFLEKDVYNKNRSETALMRLIHRLQSKDYGLQHGMVPLGSCTMKLNPAATMLPMSWPEVGNIHPLVPVNQAEGYRAMIVQLEKRLCEISGLDACSLQPNSGAQGEYAGIRVIREYLRSIGETGRTTCLIPNNAHGTNPATAHFAGMNIVKVDTVPGSGEIDLEKLKILCEKHSKTLACIMITYPSTYGVFDRSIKAITSMIHEHGGQVYIDGANFNAMVGLTGPGFIGGDVCHYNLHKTFSIPHGGGGPGMGPICVKEHLAPFLPNTAVAPSQVGGSRAFGQSSQAPYGSASILTISSMLMTMLGSKGLTKCSAAAITSANYLEVRLRDHYNVLYTDKKCGCIAHEFIIDLNKYKKTIDIEAEDVAKRLMDYGFHAPTLAFPVAGTLMVEPTESEPKEELDRFIEAMVMIKAEIDEIVAGKADKTSNLLKNAPHPVQVCLADEWKFPYSRERAAYPVPGLRKNKFWPTCSRIKGAFGDLNLHCCA